MSPRGQAQPFATVPHSFLVGASEQVIYAKPAIQPATEIRVPWLTGLHRHLLSSEGGNGGSEESAALPGASAEEKGLLT